MLCIVDKSFADTCSTWPRMLTCPWDACNYVDENAVVDVTLPDYGGVFIVLYVRQVWTMNQPILLALVASEDIEVQAPIRLGNPLASSSDPLLQRRGVSPPMTTFQLDHRDVTLQVVMEHFQSIGTLSVQCSGKSSEAGSSAGVRFNRLKCWIQTIDAMAKLIIEVDILHTDTSPK